MQNNTQRETVVYTASALKGLASVQYTKDLQRRQQQGWTLVSCTESGKNWVGHVILTAIYERGTALPGPAMPMPGPAMPGPAMPPGLNIPNLPILLSMLSPQERAGFEGEVQAVVNRWLAMKSMGPR